jgi:hypothetical protein
MLSLYLLGEISERMAGINTLKSDLLITNDPSGIPVTIEKKPNLKVSYENGIGYIGYNKPVEFFRGLFIFKEQYKNGDFSIEETPCFEQLIPMFDVSRNAVLKPETIKYFLRKLSLMGIGAAMLYTEDTYEVKDYPYFGYLRGRYTSDELHDLDDYAYSLGIELIPCIQTLGHLERAIHWGQMGHLKDTEDILLVGDEATYEFIEAMIKAACEPYRSKRIHIGMDEAHSLGSGRYKLLNGLHHSSELINEHLKRVLAITNKYSLKPMMWSDMYFRPYSKTGGYYDGTGSPTEVVEAAPKNIDLVYWDYYHEDKSIYQTMFDQHHRFDASTLFALGLWTWGGPAPDYNKMFSTCLPALEACKENQIREVIITAWGDNGAETNFLSTLYGLSFCAEYNYQNGFDKEQLDRRFEEYIGVPAHSFLDLSLLNHIPGMKSGPSRPANPSKFLLYQDPLLQLYEKDTEGIIMAQHYEGLIDQYEGYRDELPEFSLFFDFYCKLTKTLMLKCRWHEASGECIRKKDHVKALILANSIPDIITSIRDLKKAWQELWFSTNKPYGFEILDLRLGGLAYRFESAMTRMQDFANGIIDDIPELSEEKLPYTVLADGSLFGSYAWGEIVSACKI